MYQTPLKTHVAELEERRSKFIAHLVPQAQFADRLAALKRDHRKAAHVVTAFRRMGKDHRIEEGCSDDGEPSGTSGMPVLKVLQGANLVDAGIAVVRYFGGTKLGTGGLSRAYGGVAKRAVEGATLTEWIALRRKQINCDFSSAVELERFIANNGLTVLDRTYGESGIAFLLEGPEALIEQL